MLWFVHKLIFRFLTFETLHEVFEVLNVQLEKNTEGSRLTYVNFITAIFQNIP